MVIGDIPETYQRFVNVVLLIIAVNGFIKGLSHKDFNVKCTVPFSTEQLMWPVFKGPEGQDQPRHL